MEGKRMRVIAIFKLVIITARVRSTREGNVLTRVCPSIHPQICVHRGGGGPADGGGGQVQPVGGGVRSSCLGWVGGSGPARGGWVGSSWGGGWVRSSWQGGGQVQLVGGSGPAGGVGQVQLRGGWVRSSRQGGSAKIGQHNEYSLHGGRYASCIHAGELSC